MKTYTLILDVGDDVTAAEVRVLLSSQDANIAPYLEQHLEVDRAQCVAIGRRYEAILKRTK